MTAEQIREMVKTRRDWRRLVVFDDQMCLNDNLRWPLMLKQNSVGRAYVAAVDLLEALDEIQDRDERTVQQWRRYKRAYNRATR